MNISFDLLKVFKLVAYYGNVSKAAKVLCVTQPSVTKAVKKLEEELGVKLFTREKLGVKLTNDGEKIYHYILDPLNTLENVNLIAKGVEEIETGELKIGADNLFTNYYLRRAILDFKKSYPKVTVKVYNSNDEELYNKLKGGQLDLIFINSKNNINNVYERFNFIDLNPCFFGTKECYSGLKKINNLRVAIGNNLIIHSSNISKNYLMEFCIKNNIDFNPTMEFNDYKMVIDYSLASMGVGFAPREYVNTFLQKGLLVEIPMGNLIVKETIIGVYRDVKNVKIDKFRSFL